MKNSTFSAQVANNLLTLLQGYTKGIRFIALLTVLLALGVGNAWAEEVTYVFTSKDWAAKIGSTAANWTSNKAGAGFSNNGIQVTTTASGANGTSPISYNNISQIVVTYNTNTSKGKGTLSVKIGDNAVTTNDWQYSGTANGTSANFTSTFDYSSPQSGKVTLTANTTTNSIYVVSIKIVTSAGTEPPTPTTQYTIKWHTAKGVTTDVTLNEGAAITKPATDPKMTGYTFMGWTEDCEVASDGAGFTPLTNFGTADSDKDFYAVFAVATTTGGGGEEKDFSFNITTADFNTTSYAANNNEKTSTAKASDGSTMEVKWTSNQVMLQSGVMQWQKNTGYIFNSTDLGTIKSVEITKTDGTFTTYYGTSKQPSSGTTVGNGYFQIKIGNATGKSSNIKVTFTQTVAGGGSTTTYNNYITTCSGSTPVETYTVTFDANGHGTAPNAQTIISGEKATEPKAPTATGYTFGGWYTEAECTNQFDFNNTVITVDITLYAKWTIAEYTIKATLEHCTVAPEIPTTYTYTGSAANLTYTFTPEDGYGLPKTITFSGCEYTWNQSTGVLTLTGVIKSNVTFTIAAKKIHTITWMVDGDEHTNGEPSTTVLNNERVSTLPTNPTLDCSGKTFVGWSDQEVSDGNKPSVLFTSAGTSPQILKNTTFHAVFATLTGSGNGQNTTDILTHEINGKASGNTNYATFTEKKYNSNALYAGNTANSHGGVQLRSSDQSGIVTTTSGGYAKSITVEWNSNTPAERTLDIYGKNEAYTAASDLYDANTRGTKLGSIVKGTSTELTIDGDYQYIGLRSNNGAMYINRISIVWSSSAAPTYTGYTTTCTFTAPALAAPTGLTVDEVTCSSVTLSWDEVDGANGYEVVRTLNAHNNPYTTTETSYTIENLEGGKLNSWKVRAIGDGTNCSSSEYAVGENFTTLFSIKYYVDGVIWHGCDDGCAANGSFDICETEPTKANNTFAGWATTADGAVAYQAGETINNIAANVTLHAVWSDVKYTVNWSVNGVDNPVTYTHGQDLALPSIDITPCDGMDHVGWTDELGYRHGTDILFTEAEGTVTSDATYYAVFATETSSGEGTETTLTFSEKGYTNGKEVTSATQDGITVSFDKGTNSNAPKYYDTGKAVRIYGGGYFTVSSENTILSISITFASGEDTNAITTDVGTYSNNTWTGSAASITFTIGGTSGHRRIQSIAVTSSGSASYYTDYTTTCGSRQLDTPTNLNSADITHNSATLTWDEVAGARSYKVVINGTEYNTNTNSYSAHSLKSKTDYTWTVQAIGNGTTFIDSEISAEATFTTEVAVTITWIAGANKNSNTITYGQSIGQALGELPTPETPAGCKGKAFMGWSTTRNIASDGSDFEKITEDIVPTENTTYYAVFAQGDIAGAANITDELTHTINGKESSGNTYIAFTDKKYTSDALYAGSSANGYSAIQLRSTDNSGIVTTTSGGSIKSITVVWDSNTSADRTLNIYGKNTAYSAASDLYDDTKKGSLLGSIANGTSTPLTIDGNYQYIGLRSKSGAMYLTSITIVWQSGEVTYTDYSTSCGDFLVTYYGFNTGGYTTICGDNPGEKTVPQFTTYTIPTCTPTEDPQGLNRTFAGTWVDDKGNSYKPGDSFEVTKNTTLYAQWTWNTNTIPTDESGIADLATTDVVVTGGNTLTLAEGTTTINSLTLKGGLQSNGSYAMPVINIPEGATLIRNNNKINLDLTVNNQSYYPFAVPFEVQNIKANIHYLDERLNSAATYGTHYQVLTYDGGLRAENGLSDKNWIEVGRHTAQKPSYLVPGKGYAISAVPAKGETTTTIRISMDVDDGWFAGGEKASITVDETTTTRNQIAVTAYTGTAATNDPCNAGWNFVANPYLTNFAANNISGAGYINGQIVVNNGKFEHNEEEIPYVTIPNANMSWYDQCCVSDAKLSPMYSFFVQIAEGDIMTFTTAGRQQAPAALRASSEHANPSFEADIVILNSQEQEADHTGLVINDRWTPAYEIGGDLEKMFGTANRTAIYTLSGNTRLAYNALSYNDALVAIPVGFRAQADGEYTIQLSNTEDIVGVECIELKDLYNNQTTNLLYTDYTFYSDATQEDSRFVVYIVPQKNTPTDISTITNGNTENGKIIFNNHLYIIHNGSVYNGNGQIVK